MTLSADEFIRRFLIHVLPTGFHRTRHYGLFANAARSANLAKVRAMLQPPPVAPTLMQVDAEPEPAPAPLRACPCCGGRMLVIEIFERGAAPRIIAAKMARLSAAGRASNVVAVI